MAYSYTISEEHVFIFCSAMQSFQVHKAGARDSQMCVPDGSTSHAASFLALPDHHLHKLRALPMFLVFAAFLVDLIDLVVATPEAGQAFEAHLVGGSLVRWSWLAGSGVANFSICSAAY